MEEQKESQLQPALSKLGRDIPIIVGEVRELFPIGVSGVLLGYLIPTDVVENLLFRHRGKSTDITFTMQDLYFQYWRGGKDTCLSCRRYGGKHMLIIYVSEGSVKQRLSATTIRLGTPTGEIVEISWLEAVSRVMEYYINDYEVKEWLVSLIVSVKLKKKKCEEFAKFLKEERGIDSEIDW